MFHSRRVVQVSAEYFRADVDAKHQLGERTRRAHQSRATVAVAQLPGDSAQLSHHIQTLSRFKRLQPPLALLSDRKSIQPIQHGEHIRRGGLRHQVLIDAQGDSQRRQASRIPLFGMSAPRRPALCSYTCRPKQFHSS